MNSDNGEPHRYAQAEVQGTKLAKQAAKVTAVGSASIPIALRTPFAEIERRVTSAAVGHRLLDYGCGVGLHSLALAQAGVDVVGCDISPSAVAVARQRAVDSGLSGRARFAAANGEALPLASGQFDFVMSIAVLSFVDLQRSLDEMRRVLKPGGTAFILDTLGHNPILNVWRRVSVWRGTRARWSQEHILTLQQIEALSESFDVVSVKFFDLTTVFLAPLAGVVPGPMFSRLTTGAAWLDSRLLSLPMLRRLAFKVVIELRTR